ncbi:hypothetical protein ACTQZK_06555 [Paraeggerthella sp. LCP19S3_G8]|uniref:hypothetical protein n=1 Tax=Paraeggerthella sp. LCP19S3_G8 TaxID=3440248 RepID=UPI002A8A94A9|nr:hypothetical protein [Paraeggerthella sp.]
MKDFVKSLGGAGWAAFGGLSVIVTVVAAIGLPYFVDTSNPLVLLMAGTVLFIVAFANGWKQRGFRNERDIRLADDLEKERASDKEKSEVALARIKADNELKLERMRQKHEEWKEFERKADEALAKQRESEEAARAKHDSYLHLTEQQKAMLHYAFEIREVFPTPDYIPVLYMPQETLLVLNGKKMVYRVTKARNSLQKDTWSITTNARTYLLRNEDVLADLAKAWEGIFEEDEGIE